MDYTFRTDTGAGFFINVKPNAVSVAVDEITVFTFDREGRLVTAVINDLTYRRGLDNRILCKWHEIGSGEPAGRCRWLSRAEARKIIEEVHGRVCEALKALGRGNSKQGPSPAGLERKSAIIRWLERIEQCDYEQLEQDARRLADIYRPITILPPDQYLALVLQATEGCHFNRCTFCSFYRDRPFRVKPLEEFREHINDVVDFLGEGMTLRRSVFLADANAVCIPHDNLLPMLDAVNDSLFIRPANSRIRLDGIYSFVDAFSDKKGERRIYSELRARNIRRLYLGVETGCKELLRFLHKPQTPGDVLETVLAIKESGLNVGVILMLGIGGDRFAGRHVEASSALLNSIPWSAGDIVFLSSFVDFPGAEYSESALNAGIKPLSPEELSAQYVSLKNGIYRKEKWPKIAEYNAEEFIY